MTLRWTGAATLLIALAGRVVAQQGPVPSGHVSDSGTGLSIGILTVGPGEEVWERWGHNTIVVNDRDRRASASYNWGLFDFRQEDFILRFVRGRMWYSMGSHRTDRDLALYVYRDRSMGMQDLALTPGQATALRDFLVWNDTEEHRHYHYNYYLDNCSTRVRDAIDRALDGQFRQQFDTMPSGHTWRWETRRILGWDLPLYVGINLALGHPVDAGMTAWQAMFLPVRLEEYLRMVRVRDADGGALPLVSAEETLNQSARFTDPAAPQRTWLPLVLAGLLGGGMFARLGNAGRTSRKARRWFSVLASVWSFVAGSLGLVLLGLWFLTDHWAATQNENVLLLTPLSLALVPLVPLALRGRAGAGRIAVKVASVVTALGAVALAIKILPWFHQYNLELIALILPVHAGVLWGLARALAPAR